jgi:hypothetical protein
MHTSKETLAASPCVRARCRISACVIARGSKQLALHPGAHRRRSPGCAQQCALTRRRRRAPSAPRPTACQRLMAAATPRDRAACTAAAQCQTAREKRTAAEGLRAVPEPAGRPLVQSPPVAHSLPKFQSNGAKSRNPRGRAIARVCERTCVRVRVCTCESVRVPACVCVRAIACACARGGRAHVRREVAELVQAHLGTGVGPPVLPSHRHLRKLALHSKHLSLPPLAPPPHASASALAPCRELRIPSFRGNRGPRWRQLFTSAPPSPLQPRPTRSAQSARQGKARRGACKQTHNSTGSAVPSVCGEPRRQRMSRAARRGLTAQPASHSGATFGTRDTTAHSLVRRNAVRCRARDR